MSLTLDWDLASMNKCALGGWRRGGPTPPLLCLGALLQLLSSDLSEPNDALGGGAAPEDDLPRARLGSVHVFHGDRMLASGEISGLPTVWKEDDECGCTVTVQESTLPIVEDFPCYLESLYGSAFWCGAEQICQACSKDNRNFCLPCEGDDCRCQCRKTPACPPEPGPN